jgi:aromatic ring-opening dioxygenase LigB subunit
MTLVYACIAPHGGEIVPELAPKRWAEKFVQTRKGMLRLAQDIKRAKPSLIVIASPHNLRLWKNIAIVTAHNSSGIVRGSSKSIKVRARCDVAFARKLLRNAEAEKLPVVAASYGTAEGSLSDMPMDWGTLIPLWFFLKLNRMKARIVIVTPSREIPLAKNVEMGRIIAETAEDDRGRVIFVASADQAHAHKKSGPYGFSKHATEYDGRVVDAVKSNRLMAILEFDQELIEAAKPDSLWQMAMLVGATQKLKFQSKLYSYQVPTYFGMLCAAFERIP